MKGCIVEKKYFEEDVYMDVFVASRHVFSCGINPWCLVHLSIVHAVLACEPQSHVEDFI